MSWKEYKNGDYLVRINTENGTKIRETDGDEFHADFAENIDLTITHECDGACGMCYMGCTPEGKHGDIMNEEFIASLHPFTEVAINGNDLKHPDLIPFLRKLKENDVLSNITVSQKHFEENVDFIRNIYDEGLIHGLGISVWMPTLEFIKKVKTFPNAVLHVIAGIVTENSMKMLCNHGLKVLILGYKTVGRGSGYFKYHEKEVMSNMNWLKENLDELTYHFNVMSFDNLALEQLNVRRLMTDEQWEQFYMGDDGDFTFYIDMVDKTFAKNSMSDEKYPFIPNIDEMFKVIKRNN